MKRHGPDLEARLRLNSAAPAFHFCRLVVDDVSQSCTCMLALLEIASSTNGKDVYGMERPKKIRRPRHREPTLAKGVRRQMTSRATVRSRSSIAYATIPRRLPCSAYPRHVYILILMIAHSSAGGPEFLESSKARAASCFRISGRSAYSTNLNRIA